MDDDTLLRTFEDRSLPLEQWTHRSHVKVAYLYLTRYPAAEAIDRMRAGIKAYNAAHEVPDGLDMGYHETLTVAFMKLIHATLGLYGAGSGADKFCDTHPQLMCKKILRLFYSRSRIMTLEAKHGFVEPDLTALPVAPTMPAHETIP